MRKIAFILLFFSFASQAQFYLDKGDWYFGRNRFADAIKYYIKETQNSDPEIKNLAIERLVDCYMFSGKINDANMWYKKIYFYNKSDPNVVLKYALLQLANKKYKTAQSLFEKYAKIVVNDSLNISAPNMAFCDSIIYWDKYSIENADVRNLRQINSKARDFCAVVNKDEIVYCSSLFKGDKPKEEFYDLYAFSLDPQKSRNTSISIKNLSSINTKGHEGPATFSKEGRELWFTRPVIGSIINDKQLNPLNIFYRKYVNGAWTEETNKFGFDYNTDFYSSCHPAISKDGKTMFFASNMPGGYGGMDIYYVTYSDSTQWSDAVNLGPLVNTYEDELFPTIGENGVVFFSSKGHPGFGEMDLFSCNYDSVSNKWTNVKNLMKPINSSYDDFAIMTMGSNNVGLFSSDRAKGKGEDDIYTFAKNQKIEIYVDKQVVRIPNRLFFDGVSYKASSKKESMSDNMAVSNQEFVSKYENSLQQFYLALKDSLLYNNSSIEIVRKESGTIFKCVYETENKPTIMHAFVWNNDMPVGTSRNVYVLENEITIDTIQLDKKGWFEYTIPETKKYEFKAFDEQSEKDFLNRRYVKLIVKVQDNIFSNLKNAEVVLQKDEKVIANLVSDSLGMCYKTLLNNSRISAHFSKEGFFDKDTTLNISLNDSINEIVVLVKLNSKEKENVIGKIVVNNIPVADAEIVVSKGDKVIESVKTDKEGNYELHLHKNEDYDVSISKKGFFNSDTTLSTSTKPIKDSIQEKPKPLTIKLSEIKNNKVVRLNRIYFEYNSFELQPSSKRELIKLAKFLNINSKIVIEVGSHTDNRGSDAFNLILSQKRSEVVVNFLKSSNIDPDRLIASGYGETKPIVKNPITEEEHALNRRIEFKIVKTIDSTQSGNYFRVLAYRTKSQLLSNAPLMVKYKNVSVETDKSGIYKYYVSPIRTYDETKGVVKELNAIGYRDTKIEAFDDGQLVPLEEIIY
ncbi:MAG: OmpA family protein [Bacteroidota bacterium]|nr:OmpA family protein [Bacteroidota bacterium]